MTVTLFVAICLIPASFLRFVYFAILSSHYDDVQNIGCYEFGIEEENETDLTVQSYSIFVLHDLFYPLFLLTFSSCALYWYDLCKAVSESLSAAKKVTFMTQVF